MMRIITISREFGSGGREIGKRLADAFDIPYYDHEVIDMIDERHGFDKGHEAEVSEKIPWSLHFCRRSLEVLSCGTLSASMK